MRPKTYIDIVSEIQSMLVAQNSDKVVTLHWVRGHNGIRGNEIADNAANKAHTNNRTELYDLVTCEYLSVMKQKLHNRFNHYWNTETNISQKGLFLKGIRDEVGYNPILFHSKNRRAQVVMNRLRMGHVGVRSYLYRFHMAEDEYCQNPPCHQDETPETIEHFLLYCPATQSARQALTTRLQNIGVNDLSLKTLLLGNPDFRVKNSIIFGYVYQFLSETNRVQSYF